MQAHYIKIEWTDDPIIYLKLEGDEHTYFEYLHATPYHSDTLTHAYSPTQLSLFSFEHTLTDEVDDAMARIGDHTLQAEVSQWRQEEIHIGYAKKDLKEAQDRLWKLQLSHDSCGKWLVNAQAYFQLGTANKKHLSNLVMEYLARWRGCRS